MALFWYMAGSLSTLAAIVLLLPWLRTIPRLGSLPSLPWQAGAAAAAVLAASVGLYFWIGNPSALQGGAGRTSPSLAENSLDAPALAAIAGTGGMPAKNAGGPDAGVPGGAGASPMTAAVASLEARLAKGDGSASDWELLAKSYEFLDRPEDAARAREHRLPSSTAAQSAPSGRAADSGRELSGEVNIAAALSAKAAPGTTLFIVAKSVDSPGPPVAVMRTKVGDWPLRFRLDDSQAMIPGRNISSAGRVTVEARISSAGQALAAPGDLQGSSGVVTAGGAPAVKIVIDRVVQ